jgi:hypothetical protein
MVYICTTWADLTSTRLDNPEFSKAMVANGTPHIYPSMNALMPPSYRGNQELGAS